MMLVRGIGVGVGRGIVRRLDNDFGVGLGDAMDLLHHTKDIRLMLEKMREINAVGGLIPDRPRKMRKLAADVGGRARLAVEPYGPRLLFLFPTANIEHYHFSNTARSTTSSECGGRRRVR